MPENSKTSISASRVGLCTDCTYAQQIETRRGATFHRCERSAGDQRFPKYPNLPVVQCSGHQAKTLA
jgi:hypothetical protein